MTGVAPSRKRCHASACPASAGALSAELCNERTAAMADQRLGGAGGSGGSAKPIQDYNSIQVLYS